MQSIKKEILGDNADEITRIFNEMTGLADADKDIIAPKFRTIINTVTHLCNVLIQLSSFKPLANVYVGIEDSLNQIKEYTNLLHNEIINVNMSDTIINEMSVADFNKIYQCLNNCRIVKDLIVLCGTFNTYKPYLDKDEPEDEFIYREPGLQFFIFPFSTLDLKKIWYGKNVSAVIKSYITKILSHVYKDLYIIYDVSTSANADIKKVSKLLVSHIQSVRSIPELSRCQHAFNKIENSIELLETNFNSYYRDSIACKKGSVIMESFIQDVAASHANTNPSIAREFRVIMTFLQKNTAAKHPQINKIVSTLNRGIDRVEAQSIINKYKNAKDTTE